MAYPPCGNPFPAFHQFLQFLMLGEKQVNMVRHDDEGVMLRAGGLVVHQGRLDVCTVCRMSEDVGTRAPSSSQFSIREVKRRPRSSMSSSV